MKNHNYCSILNSQTHLFHSIIGGVNRRDLTPEQVLTVQCPTCGAAVGKRCEYGAGGFRSTPHRDRELDARDTASQSQLVKTRAAGSGSRLRCSPEVAR